MPQRIRLEHNVRQLIMEHLTADTFQRFRFRRFPQGSIIRQSDHLRRHQHSRLCINPLAAAELPKQPVQENTFPSLHPIMRHILRQISGMHILLLDKQTNRLRIKRLLLFPGKPLRRPLQAGSLTLLPPLKGSHGRKNQLFLLRGKTGFL